MVAAVPVYLRVEVEGVNVPLMIRGVPEPERVMVLLEALKLPAEILKILETAKSEAAVIVPEEVRLYKVWEAALSVLSVPFIMRVEVPALRVPPVRSR